MPPAPDPSRSHYDVLGVPREADRQEIRRAYLAAMRRLHPDSAPAPVEPGQPSEDDDELVAVQAAWHVLGDAQAREAYDRELGSSTDLWDDLGWGAALGDPDPASGSAAPGPDAQERPTPRPRPAPGPVPPPSDEPWRTPYAPGAVRVPEPKIPDSPRARDALTVGTLCSAWLLLAVAVLAGVLTVEAYGARRLSGVALYVLFLLTVLGLFVGAREADRGTPERAGMLGVAGIFTVMAIFVPSGLGLLPGACAVALVAASVAGVVARRRRRGALIRHEQEAAARLTAYHAAVEWNRVREALRTPGSHVERCFGVYNSDDPRFMRAVHPETGEETIRETGQPLARHAWLVVADDGEVLCAAPPGALDAWLACWPAAETAAAR